MYWLKKLLVCNPFYLVSAALLLYGVYRLSVDPHLFSTELRQLTFNFSALQGYEIVVVLTVTLLAGRKIWYDASLLVALENLLWVVPFILVSQAAFIAPGMALYFCLSGIFLAAGRVGWVRTRAGEVLPTIRGLWCAIPFLLANAAGPVLYRHFGDAKIGINIASGAAYDFHEANWFWLLPMLATILFFLPRSVSGTTPAPTARWFPLLLFSFWLTGAGVHLYSLGYVYDFPLRREQLTPVFWMLAWGWYFRRMDFLPRSNRFLDLTGLLLPVCSTIPAAFVAGSRVFFYFSAFNLFAYGALLLGRRDNRLVLHLGLLSFAAVVAALPIDFAPMAARALTQTNLLGLAALAYALVGAALSRNPKVAILGAVAALIAGGVVRQAHPDWMHWALQAGGAYFLLHSLRWVDQQNGEAVAVRIVVAAGWVIHSFVWACNGANLVALLAGPVLVALVWAIRGRLFQTWRPLTVPVAAGGAALSWPAHFLVLTLGVAPVGLLYLGGSFLLFGLGTAVALTKHRWHKPHHP